MTEVTDLDWDPRSFNYDNMVSLRKENNKTFYYALLGSYFLPFMDKPEERENIVNEFAAGMKSHSSSEFLDVDNFTLKLEVLEVISDVIGKNIYILDGLMWDVWIPEDHDFEHPLNMLYEDRDSVVLLKSVNNYEIVGISEDGEIYTCFRHSDPFIKKIWKYLYNKYASRR